MPTRLHPFDLALIVIYLVGITLFGLRFRKSGKDKSLKNYFLASNTIPWWAISLSIVSAETSTLTIISIPGVAFAGDLGFLQVVIGYMLGRIVVAALFLPKYFQGEMLTAYQLIDQRFGPTLHKVTAGLFLLTRAAAEGVRVFAVSIVVGIAIGTNDTLSIAIISALTLLYTFEGGMAAVIWTDVVQMAIYIGGTIVAVYTLGTHVQGGWTDPNIGIFAYTSHLGKLHIFNFAFNLTQSYTFWAGILGGTFLTMASHGTDQLMVQRMLAARNLRESRLALLSSGVVIFFQFTLFLLIGAGLYVFYLRPSAETLGRVHENYLWLQSVSPDRIFPTFIVTQMPIGIAGLLVAAILAAAMSNLSAALNSLSSTTVVDFYMHWRPQADDKERMMISRSSTVLWAIVLFAIAVYSVHAGGKGHVVETGLSIASVAYGCLLGVFLLGTLTRYATQTGSIIGMLCGFILNVALWKFPGAILFAGARGTRVAYPDGTWAETYLISPVTIPHIAFTWFVLIGAIATFAIGSLASLIFRKQSSTKAVITAAVLLAVTATSLAQAAQTATKAGAPYIDSDVWASRYARPLPPESDQTKTTPAAYDFTPISTLINQAIAAKKLPGAVVLIGHNNQVVFHQAYGNRKLAGEPGLDGKPSAAEPMTEDTIFDMASLTKCLATATAIMQLYEAGKLQFDDPVVKYLPEFAPLNAPANGKEKITIRELLTHYSGLPEDVSLKDPWGLAAPDKAEGIRRAMNATLYGPPGLTFKYSDINFITLGAILEKLSGQPQDEYAEQHIFKPLGMTSTTYHSFDKVCGPHRISGAAIEIDPAQGLVFDQLCRFHTWTSTSIIHTAPTAHDDESKDHPELNPDYDHLLRGTVHDPTTRRMGGVAGHAGVFSTAHDISLFAQALLDKLLHNTGPFPLKQSTLQLMTKPEQPATAQSGATIFTPDGQATKGVATRGFGWDINSAFSRPRGSIFPIGSFGHTGFTGTTLWIDPTSDTYVILLSNAIHPRGAPPISPLRGEVATAAAKALGLDRQLGLTIKPQVVTPIAGRPFTIGSQAIQTDICPPSAICDNVEVTSSDGTVPTVSSPLNSTIPSTAQPGLASRYPKASALGFSIADEKSGLQPLGYALPDSGAATPAAVVTTPDSQQITPPPDPLKRPLSDKQQFIQQKALKGELKNGYVKWVDTACCGIISDEELKAFQPLQTQTGIDVLQTTHYTALADLANHHNHTLKLGLLTNQSGIDAQGHRTVDILYTEAPKSVPGLTLTTLFSPEHGIAGTHDDTKIANDTDATTHLPVISLYGAKPADRHPTHDSLKNLDAVVIDLQDAGVRFWTYEAAMGYFLEAAATERDQYHHPLEIVILDRPNLVGGEKVQGPVSDPNLTSYTDYMPLPVRHGLTFGELARYINGEHRMPSPTSPNVFVPLGVPLTVVRMENWTRAQYFDETHLPWINPSPNLKSPAAAVLYPAIGLIETTNISVGRGTNTPFQHIGACWTPTKPPTKKSPPPPCAPEDQLDGPALTAYLAARHIPGVTFAPTTFAVAEDPNHYPGHGQTLNGIDITATDRNLLDTPELGIEILSALHHLYPTRFNLARAATLVASVNTMQSLANNEDPRTIAAAWTADLNDFKKRRTPYLLYP